MKPNTAANATKQQLIDQSIQLFASQGYGSTSIRDLCSKVGIRESSFYYYFKSKEELFNQLLAKAGANSPLAILKTIPQQSSVENFVTSLSSQLLKNWCEPENRRLRVILEIESGRDTKFRVAFLKGVDEFIFLVSKRIENYKSIGMIPDKYDSKTLAWSFIAPLAALRSTYLAVGTSKTEEKKALKIAKDHCDLWLQSYVNTPKGNKS